MQWTPLPTGAFTGIDWSRPGATAGYDPYLVWAESDAFAGTGGRAPKWMPLAVALRPGVGIAQFIAAGSPAWLQVPPAYTGPSAPSGLRYCTARVRRGFFDALQAGGALAGLVERVELGLPVLRDNDEGDALQAANAGGAARQQAEPLLAGTVFGLIDDSIALAQTRLCDAAGAPRTAYFWRQDDAGRGRKPRAMGYGRELTAADVQAAMERCRSGGLVDEGAVYAELGLSTMGQAWPDGAVPFHALDTPVSHGTHVADIAVGPRVVLASIANAPPDFDAPPTWAPANDAASRCPIVAVQLDQDTVRDTSGGSMNVHVLDGLLYILSRCDATARVVVNISFGTLAGPHDGTALLEAAMDDLVHLCGGRLEIVLAAGNSYQMRTHANTQLAANGGSGAFHWRVLPDDQSQSFLELWVQEGCECVALTVTPPGHTALPPLAWGSSGMWTDASGKPLCALVYPSRVATGRRGTCALLALAPTFAFDGTVTAPAGTWTVGLRNDGPTPAVVDGYIERDDVVVGTRTGARQSHFEDAPDLPWHQQYDMDAVVDDPSRATPIRRSGNLNSIASGAGIASVGGRRIVEKDWARYSPRTPDPDAARPARPGVVKVPNQQGYSDENAALLGLKAAGSRSGGVARLGGTSDAAPQVARQLLDR